MQTFNERVLKCLLRHLKYKIGVFIFKKILKGVKNDFLNEYELYKQKNTHMNCGFGYLKE
jgi:hypothetical protein